MPVNEQKRISPKNVSKNTTSINEGVTVKTIEISDEKYNEIDELITKYPELGFANPQAFCYRAITGTLDVVKGIIRKKKL